MTPVSRVGRPKAFAVIPSDEEDHIETMSQFYDVLNECTNLELRAVARALHREFNTVIKWKLGTRHPDLRTVYRLIDWGEKGKPIQSHNCVNEYIRQV